MMNCKNCYQTLQSMCGLHIKGNFLSESVTSSLYLTCVPWTNRNIVKLESSKPVKLDEIYANRCKWVGWFSHCKRFGWDIFHHRKNDAANSWKRCVHVASGEPYYTYHQAVLGSPALKCAEPPNSTSHYDQAVSSNLFLAGLTSPHVLNLTFYTYAEGIVYDPELSLIAITYFVKELMPDKYPDTSRLFVGLSLVRVEATSGDYVVGYVLDPDKMEFRHFNDIRVGLHYQLKNAKIGTNELFGTSHLPLPISRQRQPDDWHMIKPNS